MLASLKQRVVGKVTTPNAHNCECISLLGKRDFVHVIKSEDL